MTPSEFLHYLWANPVVGALTLLLVLMIVVPVVVGIYQGRRPKQRSTDVNVPTTRFLGTQLDLAILILGVLLLVAIVGWIRKLFVG